MAQDFVAEPSVVIAKVDAEAEQSKATAQAHGVSSYPTIKYFPRGSSAPEAYEGGRSQKDLIDFLNDKTGTHRTPGGGLDAKAGTIDALDSLLAGLGGSDVESLSRKVKDGAKGLQERYAKYYVKVAEKLSKNKDYVAKELERVEGLLKKGGLAPEKLDDLTSRSNVLRKFKGPEPGKQEL